MEDQWHEIPVGDGFGNRIPVVIRDGVPQEPADLDAYFSEMFDTVDIGPQENMAVAGRQTDVRDFFNRPKGEISTQLQLPEVDSLQLSPEENFQFFQQSVLLSTVLVPVIGYKNVQAGILGWLLNSVYAFFNFKEAALEQAIEHWKFDQQTAWASYYREFGITPANTFYSGIIENELRRISASGDISLWIDEHWDHWADTKGLGPNIRELWENGLKNYKRVKAADVPPDYIDPSILNAARGTSRMKRWLSLGLFLFLVFLMRRRRKKQ